MADLLKQVPSPRERGAWLLDAISRAHPAGGLAQHMEGMTATASSPLVPAHLASRPQANSSTTPAAALPFDDDLSSLISFGGPDA